MGWGGNTMGVLPAIRSNIYPAGVRISGFDFACNFGIMSFGGLVSVRGGAGGGRGGQAQRGGGGGA